jgi:hypothetical protein
MPSRSADVPLVALVLALLSNFLVFAWLGPGSLGPPPHGTVAAEVGVLFLTLFAAYEAFVIQRALPVRLYKNQARGIGLVALALLLLIISQEIITPFTLNGSGAFGTPINYPFIYFTWLVLFYWIDASIRTARRSDPLLRDTLRWSQVRIIVWTVTAGSMLVALSLVLYAVIATGFPIFLKFPLPLGGEQSVLNFLPFVPPVLLGAIYLPIAGYRSRDPTLRRHIAWFGLFVLCIMAMLLLFQAPVTVSALSTSEVLLLALYFLYRGARSLAPLNKLPLA